MRRTTPPPRPAALLEGPQVLEQTEHFCVAAYGNLAVVIWNGVPDENTLERNLGVLTRLARGHPSGLALLLLVRGASGVLDERVTARAVDALQRLGKHLLVFGAVNLVAPNQPPLQLPMDAVVQVAGASEGPAKFFDSVDDAVAWMESYLDTTGGLVPSGARLHKPVSQVLQGYPEPPP